MRYNPHQTTPAKTGEKKKSKTTPVPAPEPITPPCASLTIVADAQRLELRFAARPPAAMLDALDQHGWTWHHYHLAFVTKDTPEARDSAALFTKPTVPFTHPPPASNIIPVSFTTDPIAEIPVTTKPAHETNPVP